MEWFVPFAAKSFVIAGGALCLLTLLYLFIVLTSLFFRGPARESE